MVTSIIDQFMQEVRVDHIFADLQINAKQAQAIKKSELRLTALKMYYWLWLKKIDMAVIESVIARKKGIHKRLIAKNEIWEYLGISRQAAAGSMLDDDVPESGKHLLAAYRLAAIMHKHGISHVNIARWAKEQPESLADVLGVTCTDLSSSR
ncbi:MAG: hypothetical protein JXK05_09690 [Campylobacterales bacterium]|nr:hypothetical protein [Campylobacterales bacterium]